MHEFLIILEDMETIEDFFVNKGRFVGDKFEIPIHELAEIIRRIK